MGIFAPIFFVYRTFNTISNVYLAGQVSWWVYREVRKMQKEKLQADDLRERFIEEFTRQYGNKPTDEMVSLALKSYNAVEHPIQHRINQTADAVKGKINDGIMTFQEWKEQFEALVMKNLNQFG